MLAIAEANVRSWLGPDARLEFHRRDFTVDPLTDLRGPSTLALVTGGTLLNFTDPVAVLRHLRHGADLLAWVARVDNVTNRTDFASSRTGSGQDIPEKSRLLLDALNVPRDCYQPEFGFDDLTRQPFLRIRLTVPVTVAGRLRLPAGHHIRLWRYHHRSAEELGSMLVKAGYIPRYERRSRDGEYLLLTGTTG